MNSPTTEHKNPTTLWLIEDNAAFRSNLAEMLNYTHGLTCPQDFSSCEDAIATLKQGQGLPQVMIIDLSLPGMNGTEGIKHIKQISADIKCIVLTGSDREQDVFNAICEGADGYLLKNSSFDQVTQGIEDVMAGGASLDPQVAKMVLKAMPKRDSKCDEHKLTDRELEVLNLLSEGLGIKEISKKINISTHTVKFHVGNTYRKLNVQSQAGAVAKGIRNGII